MISHLVINGNQLYRCVFWILSDALVVAGLLQLRKHFVHRKAILDGAAQVQFASFLGVVLDRSLGFVQD